jgi:type IV pilus assembly protein PilV
MNKRRLVIQNGTGLVETLLVVLLVSIGVLAIMNFQHNLSYSTNMTQQQFDATSLATNEIETLRDFQVLSVTSGYSAYASIASGSSSSTVGNTTYTVTWTVSTNASPSYKTINVTVSWTDRFGNSQSVTSSSRVAGVDPATSASIM